MPDMPAPIPSEDIGTNAASQLNLEPYIGKSVVDFCGKYGSVGDSENHCAHFVSHVLQLRIPGAALCSNVGGEESSWSYVERRNGYCVRVNQVFNSCKNRARWNDNSIPRVPFFVVATVPANIESEDPLTIGTMSRKHIGIYVGGMIYNYGNASDAVRKVSVATFKHHYGATTVLLKADLP